MESFAPRCPESDTPKGIPKRVKREGKVLPALCGGFSDAWMQPTFQTPPNFWPMRLRALGNCSTWEEGVIWPR